MNNFNKKINKKRFLRAKVRAVPVFVAIAAIVLALALQGCKGESKLGKAGELEQPQQEQPQQEKLIQKPEAVEAVKPKVVKAAISDFVRDTLIEAYWPDSFEPVPKLTPSGVRDSAPDGYYGLLWEKGGVKFFLNAFFKTQKSRLEIINLRTTTTADIKNTNELTSFWANNFWANKLKEQVTAEDFSCEEQKTFEPVGTVSVKFTAGLFCNYVNIKENNDKSIITTLTHDGKTSLFVCEIPEGSSRYNATNCYR